MIFRLFSLLMFSLVATNAFALQTKIVDDNQKVTASIAKNEINRITVENDRIAQVIGLDGTFTVETEETSGQIFIKPTSDKQLHLSLITEKNTTVDLTLKPVDAPPETILLKKIAEQNYEVNDLPVNTPYVDLITDIVEAMVNFRPKKTYITKYERRELKNIDGIKVSRIATYEGKNNIGEILILKNTTNSTIVIDEKKFLNKDLSVIGIALEKLQLLPNEEGKLYLVKSS